MSTTTAQPVPRMLNKVPQVIALFWIIKIMATTVGETGADFLSVDLHLGSGATGLITAGLLTVVLYAQLRARRYEPWLYWLTVVLVSVVGTLLTDNLVDRYGVRLETTTALFGLALLATFIAWYVMEATLSIRTIVTRRRELFYWAAILFTFALGTSAGDLAAERWGLGYATSSGAFGIAIVVIAVAYYLSRLNAVAAFWLAYILTRPFGASFGDLLSKPWSDGGLGLGTVGTSGLFLAVIASLVFYLTRSRRDAQPVVIERDW